MLEFVIFVGIAIFYVWIPYLANKRGRNWLGFLFLELILSPFLALIVLFVLKDKSKTDAG